eukprot:TRINITY_DN935_c5_g1_i1.p1 TRINITY_DN935_c5_g1~~TRINITY_DN935_c5_g1_i1.p1  ORF type:complete len:907 (+),score=140.01 TRINITY_DN935_c5_g1_i1:60-2780(+)
MSTNHVDPITSNNNDVVASKDNELSVKNRLIERLQQRIEQQAKEISALKDENLNLKKEATETNEKLQMLRTTFNATLDVVTKGVKTVPIAEPTPSPPPSVTKTQKLEDPPTELKPVLIDAHTAVNNCTIRPAANTYMPPLFHSEDPNSPTGNAFGFGFTGSNPEARLSKVVDPGRKNGRNSLWFHPAIRFLAKARRKRVIVPLHLRHIRSYVPLSLCNSVADCDQRLQENFATSLVSIPLGLPAPTVNGDWEAILRDGKLFMLQKKDKEAGTKSMWFYNGTRDTHFTLEYKFNNSKLTHGSKVCVVDENHCLVVSPGETQLFVKGVWVGYRVTVKFGGPSAEYLKALVTKFDKQVLSQMALLKEVAEEHQVDITNDSAMGQLCKQRDLQYVDRQFPPRQCCIAREWEQGEVWPWMRPVDYLTEEVGEEASLFVSGTHPENENDEPIQPNDIDQGKLGDCWLMCAISAMAEQPVLVRKLFNLPVTKAHRQAGAYSMRLCKHGWWQEIVVDNYLPSQGRSPVFASNVQEPAELWVALVEKVVAKVHGSYAAISSGDSIEALQDLTGYPAERFRWDDEGLFDRLLKFDDPLLGGGEYLMTVETPGVDKRSRIGGEGGIEEDDAYGKMGLVPGHAYTLLTPIHVFPSNGPKEGFRLCRIRNPWGDAKEWRGRWGDSDEAWTEYPEVAQECALQRGSDGTFWMQWEDVKKWFCGGGVCFVSLFWHDIRFATEFRNGHATRILEVSPREAASCFIGVHQRDTRGLSSEEDQGYAAVLISVVTPQPDGGYAVTPEGHSNEKSFWRGRDTHLHFNFEYNPEETRPSYIVWQCHNPELNRQVTVSLIASSRFAKIRILQPDATILQSVKYDPLWKFDPCRCRPARVRAQLQYKDTIINEIDMTSLPAVEIPPMDV